MGFLGPQVNVGNDVGNGSKTLSKVLVVGQFEIFLQIQKPSSPTVARMSSTMPDAPKNDATDIG
jgi:hypothetical protein